MSTAETNYLLEALTEALLAVQLGVCGLFSLVVAAAMGDMVVPRSAVVWQALAVTAILPLYRSATEMRDELEAYLARPAAAVEVPSPAAGVLSETLIEEGETVVGIAGQGLLVGAQRARRCPRGQAGRSGAGRCSRTPRWCHSR